MWRCRSPARQRLKQCGWRGTHGAAGSLRDGTGTSRERRSGNSWTRGSDSGHLGPTAGHSHAMQHATRRVRRETRNPRESETAKPRAKGVSRGGLARKSGESLGESPLCGKPASAAVPPLSVRCAPGEGTREALGLRPTGSVESVA
jgi:hypothetical protein